MMLVLAGAGLAGSPALAQTASQITPATLRPPVETQGAEILIPENAGPQAPAGAEALSVSVGALRVEGGRAELAGETQALEAQLSGRRVTAAAIFAAAQALESAYARAGYVLVRVVVPPQRLTDGGAVRLVVLDGRIEGIDAAAVPPAVRARIEALLEPLVGVPGLTLSEIERRLLLAGDTPGTVLRSALKAGAAPGASVLVVEARFKPVTGSLSVDNTVSAPIGGYYAGTSLEVNSPAGRGELVYLRAGGDFRPTGHRVSGRGDGFFAERPRDRLLAAGVVLPLGTNGLSLTLEGVDARTTPRRAADELGIASQFQRLSARLTYPLVRSRAVTLNVEGGLEAEEERVEAFAPIEAELSHDSLRVARLGTDLSSAIPGGGTLAAELRTSFGISGLGARTPPPQDSDAVPASRQGTRPDFRKAEAALSFSQPLAEHLALDLRARMQTSFGEALPGAEQIGLSSQGGLSAFEAGLFQGDAGYVLRGEVQLPFVTGFTLPFALPDLPVQQGAGLPEGDTTAVAFVVSPYVFAAFGETWLEQPTVLEASSSRGTAYGGGLRFGAAAQARFTSLSGSLEYGRAEVSDAGPGETPERDRVTFSLSLAF